MTSLKVIKIFKPYITMRGYVYIYLQLNFVIADIRGPAAGRKQISQFQV